MTTYIICALLLAFLQTWLVPAAFNMKNFPWLGSNRDEPMPHDGRQSQESKHKFTRNFANIFGFGIAIYAAIG
jgi:hypothetical protein